MRVITKVIRDFNKNGYMKEVDTLNMALKINEEIGGIVDSIYDMIYTSTGIRASYHDIKESSSYMVYDRFKKSFVLNKYMFEMLDRKESELLSDEYFELDKMINYNRDEFLVRDVIEDSLKDSLALDWVNENYNLFTFYFKDFENRIFYKDSGLNRFFSGDFLDNTLSYLHSKSVNISETELLIYLKIKSSPLMIMRHTFYRDYKRLVAQVDNELGHMLDGVISCKTYKPKDAIIEMLENLFENCNFDFQGVYHYSYDKITIRVDKRRSKGSFLNDFAKAVNKSCLQHIPYRCVVGESLLNNLKEVETGEILNNCISSANCA